MVIRKLFKWNVWIVFSILRNLDILSIKYKNTSGGCTFRWKEDYFIEMIICEKSVSKFLIKNEIE